MDSNLTSSLTSSVIWGKLCTSCWASVSSSIKWNADNSHFKGYSVDSGAYEDTGPHYGSVTALYQAQKATVEGHCREPAWARLESLGSFWRRVQGRQSKPRAGLRTTSMAGPQRSRVKARTGQRRPLHPKGSESRGKSPAGEWSDLGFPTLMLAVTQRESREEHAWSPRLGPLKAMGESVAKLAIDGSGPRIPGHISLTRVPRRQAPKVAQTSTNSINPYSHHSIPLMVTDGTFSQCKMEGT